MITVYRLGEWTIRPQHANIERGDEVVHLKPKPMAVLECLRRAGGEVVTRDELFESVWPGGVVSDATLTQCIVELRRAFGDSAQTPRVIKTIPKVGFCLVPSIEELAPDTGIPEVPLKSNKQSVSKRFAAFGIALVVAVLAFGAWWYQRDGADSAHDSLVQDSAAPASIAVLPFINMSDEPGNEYFVDGLTEELQILLAKIPQLKVSARTSSFAFRDKDATIAEIARTLNVAHLLEGSVRKSGNRIRVSVQLIEAQSGFELWSESYDRTLNDIFAVQDDVAASVVGALRISLMNEPPRLRETDAEVYSLYLQGKYLMTPPRGGKENLENAVSAFEQVLAIDPDYAPAWVGISWAYEYQRREKVIPEEQAIALARDASERALAIDDKLPLAWSTLAFIRKKYDWDWEGAEFAMDKALQLQPNNADVFTGLGSVASSLGQLDKSIELLERAVALDPLGLQGHLSLGLRYRARGRYDDALELYKRTLVLYPENAWTLENIAETYLRQGNPERALAEMEKLPYSDLLNNVKAETLFILGREKESRALVSEFLDTPAEFGPFAKAQIYAWQGEHDDAFRSLEIAFEQHHVGLANILLYIPFRYLEADPRYPVFLEKLGLLEAWQAMP
jgi:TolB-like protein/DNA-binding winged helix-turn-helix (wHTH) protein/Tfp pilus assembly protein PilF